MSNFFKVFYFGLVQQTPFFGGNYVKLARSSILLKLPGIPPAKAFDIQRWSQARETTIF